MCLRASIRLFSQQHPSSSLVSFKYAPLFRPAPPGTNFTHDPWEVPCFVTAEVVTEAEERALLSASSTWFDRIDSNENHVDALIHHYKEFYRPYGELLKPMSPLLVDALASSTRATANASQPNALEQEVALCQAAIQRCHGIAQTALPTVPLSARVHFLQLTGSGFIRAHVDESRNSSGVVAGLTLASARVMTLTHPKHPTQRIELFLKPRSFYMLLGSARTEWEHSVDWTGDDDEHISRMKKSLVVDGSEVMFEGQPTGFRRGLRTAMIFRGISPMDLLLHRMELMRQQSAAPPPREA
jgi:hypothetical protein